MEQITNNELESGFKLSMMNPYAKLKSILKERRIKKQEKLLQMKLAIITGGITKVK